jgi:4-hydroxy-3-methylbut-2-en-1-yl diphosphate synthase IspG/GcpE
MDAIKIAHCPQCGASAQRLYSPPQLILDRAVDEKTEYNHSLGCVVRTKRDVKEAQKRINFESNGTVNPVTVSPKEAKTIEDPKTTNYDEVTEEACRILSSST